MLQRWNFPSKQYPAHKDEELVARVKELWESNHGQKEMLTVLANEGFNVTESDLMRLRSKKGWLLRGSQGYQSTPNKIGPRKKRKTTPVESDGEELDDVRSELNAIAGVSTEQAVSAVDEAPVRRPPRSLCAH